MKNWHASRRGKSIVDFEICSQTVLATKKMNFLFVFREYCLNCSIAGLSYIADGRFHYTERVFWLLCLILSTYGSYYLIRQSLDDFEEGSISMTVESLQPRDVTYFPSVGVCEIGHTKELYNDLEGIVQR